jgi:hypothetical protein
MNGARGEVELRVDGVARRVCVTLGALAEMEGALGCASLAELEVRLKRLSARDMLVVLGALLRGGGEMEAAARLALSQVEVGEAVAAVRAAFAKALA